MEEIITVPKKWGNSLGITIPADIVEKQHIKPGQEIHLLILPRTKPNVRKLFGTVKLNKSTQQLMDEIDEGYD